MVLRFAGFGLGSKGITELRLCSEIDDVRIVAGVDVSPSARERFEAEFEGPTYEHPVDLLDRHAPELDAVIVCTPHTLHYEQVTACFERGLDVFVEKPLATSIEDAVRIVEMADEEDRHLQVGYQRHFHPGLRTLREIVRGGEIGSPHMISGYLEQEWIGPMEGSWRTDPELSGGGQLFDSGAHLLDAVLWLSDAEPISVVSTMDDRDNAVDVNSAFAATLARNDETITASVSVTGDGLPYPNTSERLRIWGTKGAVEYVRTLEGEIEVSVAEKPGTRTTPRFTPLEADGDYDRLTESKLRNFVAGLRGEEALAVPGEYGLQVTALTEAIRLADERGERVSIQEEIAKCRSDRSRSR